ncbi:helix-turn-helix domain-containing protein [Streptomyces hokutonensis]|uniref:Helix-turn-helix domain-containing protein n=1 Tax=Streptomyces hokutonensis TaxID=1306990 RepID=A0ABW6M7B7_9ACTN
MDPQPEKPFIFTWTGAEASSLRQALRMTQDQLSEYLGVSVRTVSRWDTTPTARISRGMQDTLDTAYERLNTFQVQRFLYALKRSQPREVTSPVVMAAEMTLMQARINELQEQLDSKERQS